MAREAIATVSTTGTISSPDKIAPDEARSILVALDRTSWTDFSGAQLVVSVFASLDGVKWEMCGNARCKCGPAEYDGKPAPKWAMEAQLPKGAGRRIRVEITCLGKAVDSAVEMEFL